MYLPNFGELAPTLRQKTWGSTRINPHQSGRSVLGCHNLALDAQAPLEAFASPIAETFAKAKS